VKNVERFSDALNFRPVDRLPIIEWATWWDKTIARWRGEGLPDELRDEWEIREYLGLDSVRQLWISPRTAELPEPECHGAPRVTGQADYEKNLIHLYPELAFDADGVRQWIEPHRRGDMVVWITLEGFFWFPRTLLGIERHLYAFYDEPELIHRMNADLVEFNLRTLDCFCRLLRPEFMTFAEDMSYNLGPMLSKELFDEFMAPYYRRIVPEIRERGIVPIVDSDGDVTSLVPWLEEAGIQGILPLERQSGVDVVGIRAAHPRFRMIGGFDKQVMKRGEEAMRAEFERLLPAIRTGGYIPSVDHQTPPDVSLETYRLYVLLLREYCEKGAQDRGLHERSEEMHDDACYH